MLFGKAKRKVFIIGRNKTGTTSLGAALSNAGLRLGRQDIAERMAADWARRDFRSIIKYCKSAEVFQDVPFSLPYTFQAVDQAFPGARFILTVRDNGEQWYRSLTEFHTKLIGKKRLPTAEDLKSYPYVYPGWLWQQQVLVYGIDESSLYNQDKYIAHYESYNASVEQYFQCRAGDLLVLNLSDPDAARKLEQFLKLPAHSITIPHLNKTSE